MARILVIDDDESYRMVLRGFIEEKGHTVLEANGADAGMQIFLNEKIDLVVSDLMMPVKSGIELLHELRRVNPRVLFIMITGYPTMDSATSAIRDGAYDYLVKPVDMTQLQAVMTRALSTLELRTNVSALRGVNWALWISIPFWIALGFLIRAIFSKRLKSGDLP